MALTSSFILHPPLKILRFRLAKRSPGGEWVDQKSWGEKALTRLAPHSSPGGGKKITKAA